METKDDNNILDILEDILQQYLKDKGWNKEVLKFMQERLNGKFYAFPPNEDTFIDLLNIGYNIGYNARNNKIEELDKENKELYIIAQYWIKLHDELKDKYESQILIVSDRDYEKIEKELNEKI